MTPLFVILIIILIFPLETSPRDTSVFQGTAARRVYPLRSMRSLRPSRLLFFGLPL